MNKIKNLVLSAAIAIGIVQFASAQAVIPGWLTDPTAVKDAMEENTGYQTPEAFRYPYISTYYVKPTVTTGEVVKIGFYVTDFEQSKIRFLDDSHRFTAYLEYRLRDGAATRLTLTNLPDGDAEFNLGKLPVGEYEMRVWAKDAQNRESHRVLQDFRVVVPEDLVIPPAQIYQVTAADLAAYSIQTNGNYEELVYVSSDATVTNVVKAKRGDVPGYKVYVPLTEEGKVPYRAYEKVSVVYDEGYDTNAVEQAAIATAEGIQRLLNDKADAGFRKVILLPGVYRVSHSVPIGVPDRMTFDLGGATVKLNQFAGERSIVFKLTDVTDAHLTGGTIEGDYWAHDYAHSTKDSEWVSGFEISGDTWYSSVEDVKVVDVAGYGGQNGISGNANFIYESLPSYSIGGLNPLNGTVDSADTSRYTTDFKSLNFKDLNKLRENHGRLRFQISKYLGYQGLRTRSWQMTVCWYDSGKHFISSETAWQYREMWIPDNAAYMRVSVEAGSLEEANPSPYTEAPIITYFRYPINCAVKNCTFEHCRCVGYAASQMKNWIFEGNYFTTSGEAEAKCAFDAEDGADQMQDTYFLRNTFRDNPINNSILTCAGHNFILEQNDCSIHFWGRTHSPCVRDNDVGQGTYYCDSRLRSGYARFENNRYSKGIKIGMNDMTTRPDNWDHVISGRTFDGATDTFKLEVGKAGRVVGCVFTNMTSLGISRAYACIFDNCSGYFSGTHWSEVTMRNSTFKDFYGSNIWDNCHFGNSTLQGVAATSLLVNDCDFTDSTIFGFRGAHIEMNRCVFTRTTVEGNWWESPTDMLFKNCDITTRSDAAFLKLGVYTIGEILFDTCTVSGGQKLVNVHDVRPLTSHDSEPGTIEFRNLDWNSESTKVVTHSDGKYDATISTKDITFIDRNNVWPQNVQVVTDLFPTWHLVVATDEVPDATITADYYVSPTGRDTNDGLSPQTAFATIAHAADVAQAGQTVGVLAGTYLITQEISVNKAITILGEGWEKSIIKQTSYQVETPSSRCITLDGGATLRGVTLTGGDAYRSHGGGAWVKNGTISWCCISNNTTSSGSTYTGAGVSFASGKGTIDHCLVAGNTLKAGWGAGIGANYPAGNILIDTCLVYGNENKGGSSGGIAIDNTTKTTTIRNCTVTDNKATVNVGGVYSNNGSGGKLVLVNDIISANKQNSNEINLFIQKSHLDQDNSASCIVTSSTADNSYYRDAGVVSLLSGKGFISTDPAFSNAANHNYRLNDGSPAIRSGVNYPGIGNDLNKAAFAVPPSIGCYEYIGVLSVADPVFTPASTWFYPSTNVTLTCATEGATIRYTTDGSEPTTSSLPYSAPISVSVSTTIKAKAFKSGLEPSAAVTATYTYEEPQPPVLGEVTVTPLSCAATVSGTISSIGNNGATSCDVYLALGTTAGALSSAAKIVSGATASFNYIIPDLTAETTYYYMLSISNNAATATGTAAGGNFTTEAEPAPEEGLQPVSGNPVATRQKIQTAIDSAALESPAGTVILAEGIFEIDAQLSVTDGVTLKGQGLDKTIIRVTAATAEANTRCITLNGGAKLESVTLTGGNCTDAGAGALVINGTISWCCISNNAANADGISGGGISFTNGRGQIDHSIVTDNTIDGGSWGAGIGGRYPAGAILVDTCLVCGNSDRNGSGGGIGFQNSSITVTIRNSTIADNQCTSHGGGIYYNDCNSPAKIVLINDIISGNKEKSSEQNTFIKSASFIDASSSNCLITGNADVWNGIIQDKDVRNVIANSISATPLFVNAVNCNYRLAEGSPALGTGVKYIGIGRDLDNVVFARNPSIGCFECGHLPALIIMIQ